jgi:hypothetical protein
VKGGGDSDGEEAPKARPRPAKRARKAGSDDEDGGGKRKGTGFGKPLPLSDALAAACGKSKMNRGEICKWLYAYCDEHNLKVGGGGKSRASRWALFPGAEVPWQRVFFTTQVCICLQWVCRADTGSGRELLMCPVLCCAVCVVCAQDPSDKRFAICDATLQQLTGESRIQLFGGQKYFKEHILGK